MSWGKKIISGQDWFLEDKFYHCEKRTCPTYKHPEFTIQLLYYFLPEAQILEAIHSSILLILANYKTTRVKKNIYSIHALPISQLYPGHSHSSHASRNHSWHLHVSYAVDPLDTAVQAQHFKPSKTFWLFTIPMSIKRSLAALSRLNAHTGLFAEFLYT